MQTSFSVLSSDRSSDISDSLSEISNAHKTPLKGALITLEDISSVCSQDSETTHAEKQKSRRAETTPRDNLTTPPSFLDESETRITRHSQALCNNLTTEATPIDNLTTPSTYLDEIVEAKTNTRHSQVSHSHTIETPMLSSIETSAKELRSKLVNYDSTIAPLVDYDITNQSSFTDNYVNRSINATPRVTRSGLRSNFSAKLVDYDLTKVSLVDDEISKVPLVDYDITKVPLVDYDITKVSLVDYDITMNDHMSSMDNTTLTSCDATNKSPEINQRVVPYDLTTMSSSMDSTHSSSVANRKSLIGLNELGDGLVNRTEGFTQNAAIEKILKSPMNANSVNRSSSVAVVDTQDKVDTLSRLESSSGSTSENEMSPFFNPNNTELNSPGVRKVRIFLIVSFANNI